MPYLLPRSPAFQDFIAECLQKNPELRPDAAGLLEHPFIRRAPATSQVILDLISRVGLVRHSRLSLGGGQRPSSASTAEASSYDTIKAAKPPPPLPGHAESTTDGYATLVKAKPPTPPPKNIGAVDTLKKPKATSAGTPSVEPQLERLRISNPSPLPESLQTPSEQLSVIVSQQYAFKALRICRLSRPVACAELIGDLLLLAIDDGLFGFDMALDKSLSHMLELSSRRYVKLVYSRLHSLLISISGKQSVLVLHQVPVSLDKLKKSKKFENETNSKKLKETKGCLDFVTYQEAPEHILMAVTFTESILILKWVAEKNCVLKIRQFNTPSPNFGPIMSLAFYQRNQMASAAAQDQALISGLEPQYYLIVQYKNEGLFSYHITANAMDKLSFDTVVNLRPDLVLPSADRGRPFGKVIALDCIYTAGKVLPMVTFETCGIVLDEANFSRSEGIDFSLVPDMMRLLIWRKAPIKFSHSFPKPHSLCVVGVESIVDVWEVQSSGRIVHIFETKKNKLHDLSCLLIRENKCFLVAHEDKGSSTSVIVIEAES